MDKSSSVCERERTYIEKMNKFQLPNPLKKYGWVIVLISVGLIITKKVMVEPPIWLKFVILNLMIIGFTIISLSKEKIEDELMESLRAQSYRIAFILAIVYSLVQPYIEVGVKYLVNSNPTETVNTFSYFQVLIFMLMVQIGFFYQLKKINS